MMKRFTRIVALLLSGSLLLSPSSFAQQDKVEGGRKIVSKVTPPYPALARSMALTGTVKLEALVASNGSVRSVSIKGGHPVLADAASRAVSRWKWEAVPSESREIVEVRFNPE